MKNEPQKPKSDSETNDPNDELVLTPGGWRPKSKVHHIGKGHHVIVEDGKFKKVHTETGKVVAVLDDVKPTNKDKPNYPDNVFVPKEKQSPSFGSGWIAYAFWNNFGDPIVKFSTTWVVPPVPDTYTSATQIFIFNGLQNSGYILQPVLQFGHSNAGGGEYWGIANWYVDGQGGTAMYGDFQEVSPGDTLTGIMYLEGYVGDNYAYKSTFDGYPDLDFSISNIEETNQAVQTLEAYGITTCSNYPTATKIEMTDISIQIDNDQADLDWTPVNAVTDCNQECIVVSNASPGGEVDIYFNSSFLTSRTIGSTEFANVYLRMDGHTVTSVEPSGGGTVNCQYEPPVSYEQFVFNLQSDGSYTIESAEFVNVFLRMDGSGVTTTGGTVNCQYTPPGSYEKFTLIKNSDGTFSIESVEFPNTYLRMDGSGVTSVLPNGGGTVNCAKSIGTYEKFTIYPAPF